MARDRPPGDSFTAHDKFALLKCGVASFICENNTRFLFSSALVRVFQWIFRSNSLRKMDDSVVQRGTLIFFIDC